MEEKRLKDMIERFFNAELTAEEEQALCRYLYANEVPAELRKDREVIIALCGTPEEVVLPEGAAERLEAMLDGLEEMNIRLNPPCEGGLEAPHSRHSLPHREGWVGSFLLRAACVAGVAVALFLALPDNTDEALLTEVYEEKDTFDNPEEAMQCLMAAYNDIKYAMNTARDNTHEAYRALEQSVITNLNVLKIETIKAKEL